MHSTVTFTIRCNNSTLHNAYAQIISAMLESAQAHINLADSLTSQVVDVLKATERRHEEAKKKQEQHFTKLLSERDRAYSERQKVVTIYFLYSHTSDRLFSLL